MDSLILTPATEGDREFAYQVKKAAFREYVEQVWGWNEDEQRTLHERRFASQDFRVITVAGARVGIMAVVVQPDCLMLNQLFLLPECQSKGIGAECMARVVEEARGLDRPVRLQVLKVNDRARTFYERLGFGTIGETQTHVVMERRS